MESERGTVRKTKVISEGLFMIANMIVSVFAFSFLIAAASAIATPVVSAAESQVCCEKLKDKSLFCQNSILANCDANYNHAQTSCLSTDYCKPGCCYDSKEGTCAENTPRTVCNLMNGTWDPSANCNIPQCQKGCCVLGDQASLTTLVRCKKLESYYGLAKDFRSGITTEGACVEVMQAQDKGACVIANAIEKTCEFTTRIECNKITHNETAFYKNYLCSAEELGTLCTRQHTTGCIEGRDEVYWFDSCGNPENIYDANKDRSWNKGRILDKVNSCNSNSGNTKDLLCGNCQYSKGSMCGAAREKIEPKPAYGDYICRDLDCYKTYNGKDYKHGESWCVSDYNVAVGQGKDAVGSRQWRHLCVMGEEKVEPCDDYRQGICVEGKIQTPDGNLNEASCRANAWKLCIDYNSKPNPQQSCNQDPDCYFYTAWKFPLCLPQVPPGFDLKNSASAGAFCGMATQECKVVYVKGLGGWECKQNCECKEQSWVNQMNKWCTSLGDCGGKYNIAKVYTKDGYTVSGTSAQPSEDSSGSGSGNGLMGGMMSLLPGFAAAGAAYLIPAQSALQQAITNALGQEAAKQLGKEAIKQIATEAVKKGTVEGAKSVTTALVAKGVAPEVASKVGTAAGTTMNQATKGATQYAIGGANTLSSIIGAVALVVSVYFLAKSFGFSTGAAIGIAVASLAVATVLWALQIVESFAVACGWVGLIVMVIMYLLQWIFGWGKSRVEIVKFTCLPWQPPSGGADCEKCNKPPIGGELRQCSNYRCDSLGAACSLLNEGTGNETCIWLNQNDANAPTIKPWQSVLTKDHSYQNVEPCKGNGCFKIVRDTAKNGCIQAFTPLTFGIETNEPSQCRVDTNHTARFDDMQYFFADNLYLYNHSTRLSLPSPAAMNAYSPELKNDGNYTIYVRCRDANGNWNLAETSIEFCVDPGPDLTPPLIMRTSLENGAPISSGTASTPLDIFVSEPSECKWSSVDKDYNDMESSFSCASELADMENDMTYKCSTTLTGIKDSTESRFYFRCKDQPLLNATNESNRNVNKESYLFVLQGTSPLKILSAEPNGTVSGGIEPIRVDLKVETTGGYANGESTCFFSDKGYDNMIEFFLTGSSLFTNIHEQKVEVEEGSYTYYILCSDLAGNVDKTTISFTAELDKTPPSIIRVYQDLGMLKIITDEGSDCRYGVRDCNFDFSSATEMPIATTNEHTAEWRTDATYYIKCMDNFANMPSSSQCTMIVNAYDVKCLTCSA